MQAIGHTLPHRFIMKNTDNGRATRARLFNETHDCGAVNAVERCRRLIQQQHGIIGNKATGDVDALLLSTGERRGCQGPEALRDVEPGQQIFGARFAEAALNAATPRSSSGCMTISRVGTRGMTRRN